MSVDCRAKSQRIEPSDHDSPEDVREPIVSARDERSLSDVRVELGEGCVHGVDELGDLSRVARHLEPLPNVVDARLVERGEIRVGVAAALEFSKANAIGVAEDPAEGAAEGSVAELAERERVREGDPRVFDRAGFVRLGAEHWAGELLVDVANDAGGVRHDAPIVHERRNDHAWVELGVPAFVVLRARPDVHDAALEGDALFSEREANLLRAERPWVMEERDGHATKITWFDRWVKTHGLNA